MRPTTRLLLLLPLLGCAAAEVPRDPGGVVPDEQSDAAPLDQGDDGSPFLATWVPGDPWSSGDGAAWFSVARGDGVAASDDSAAPTTTGDADPGMDVMSPSPLSAPPFDPGEGGICTGAPNAGDLVITELMIESVAGAGDHGEWMEVASTLGCAIDLRGLHGNAPSGAQVRTFDIGGDVWIPGFGTFVVADSTNTAISHALPGVVIAWSGQPGDVLRNKGGTVTLQYEAMVIDTVTYPALKLMVGTSMAFPSDCPPTRRTDWTAWQPSTASWFPGFYGTPNEPNDDVQCP